MNPLLNETHDPKLRSWIDSANSAGADFPIQNLPFGVFRARDDDRDARIGVAIGDQILDLAACVQTGFLDGESPEVREACGDVSLNALMALGRRRGSMLRRRLSEGLRADHPSALRHQEMLRPHLVAMREVEMLLPAEIGDYTDFYASVYHATNVGSMFRPDNPLLPNYKYVPVGYHGRASSVVVSGTPVRRPRGQFTSEESARPIFGPTRLLDYELEIGCFVGSGNAIGEPIPIDNAEESLFGLCLVNDWSARDIQRWEYQPLGPFLAKSFATTVSAWVVTMEALAPFRIPAAERPEADPAPLPYLYHPNDEDWGAIDVTLEVCLQSSEMRAQRMAPVRLSRGSFRDMYWTLAQMVTHHAGNGCNLRPGDLIASGTVSGKEKSSRGCLLELTWTGMEPVTLPTGEEVRFLRDGDEVILRGYCEREGFARIGFGECRGTIAAASP